MLLVWRGHDSAGWGQGGEKHLSHRNLGYKRPLESSNPIQLETGVLPALGHVGCDFVFLSLQGLQG